MTSLLRSFFSRPQKQPVISNVSFSKKPSVNSPEDLSTSTTTLPDSIESIKHKYSSEFDKSCTDIAEIVSGLPLYTLSQKCASTIFDEKKHKPLRRENVPGMPGCFSLHHVLSPQECQKLIALTENATQYEYAKISVGPNRMIDDRQTRNNRRVMIQVPQEEMLNVLFERIREFVPKNITWHDLIFQLHSLNTRLRFYRYTPGEYFAPHLDGYFSEGNKRSWLTFIVYLSGDCKGGETTFFNKGTGQIVHSVQPEVGKALLFFHGGHVDSPLHEGSLLKENVKYVLRSDVMYELVDDEGATRR